MSYASKDNIDALTGGTTSRRVTRRLLDRCLARADAMIDARLYSLYSVPFASPYPDLIVQIAEDLTLYYLYTFTAFSGVAGNTDEARRELWESAMDTLDLIVNGDILLPDVTASGSGSSGARRLSLLTSTTEDYQSVFDMDDEKEWEVDSDLLNDIDDRRD